MSTLKRQVFGTGFMLAMTLAAFAALAQDETDEDFMPAVDTSAMPAVDTSADAGDAEGPGPSEGVTRSTAGSRVMDTMELSRTEVTGNQELPKVLYIVPWQKSDPGDLMGRPVNSLLDEVLAPVDREEFIRQVEYYDELYGDSDEAE